jgi:hypothetical protein
MRRRQPRRLAFAALLLAGASAFPVVPACSSNGAVAQEGDGGDGGIAPNRLVGQPCDPTLASPCAPAPATPYGCFTVACVVGTCMESQSFQGCMVGDNEDVTFFEAGGGTHDAGIASCMSNEDCPSRPATDASPAVTLVCGYSAFDQCATTGICVSADPPHLIDGAVQTACGCDGQSVGYVTDDLTSAPVETSTPCATKSTDSGAGSDAASDAGAGSDAETDAAPSDDGGADAAADAPQDAPGDG